MKKCLPIFAMLLGLAATPALAQIIKQKVSPELMQAVEANQTYDLGPGFHQTTHTVPFRPNLENTFRGPGTETIIGYTDYDLQTNSSVCNRISETEDGRIMATWTMGFDETGESFPDRGTGYNMYNGEMWGPALEEGDAMRLEETARTGWPNHAITNSGTEFIVNHVFANEEYRLHTLRREAGETDWTENDMPTNTPSGVLWPRMVKGGADGETIHVIGITAVTGLGAEEYLGVNGHILYYRSQDGGASWDIVDGVIPGLDSTLMRFTSADSYQIDARGETIAIGVFNQWSDITVFKSTDNGDSWEKHQVLDFPVDGYRIDDGYTVEDLPPVDTTFQPDSLAIFTSDDAGNIILDNNDMAHVFFGEMFVQDSDTTDGGTFVFYPATNGLAYWNESFGADSIRTIAGVMDLNGDTVLNINSIDNIASYFVSLTSHPSAGVDADNNIFLAYSMMMEGEDFRNPGDDEQYRHIAVIASTDGGETWSEPYDIVNPDVIVVPDLTEFVEAVYPSMVRNVGEDKVRFIYQQDFQPGLAVGTTNDDAFATNSINFVEVSKAEFGLMVETTEVVDTDYFQLRVQPNPTPGEVQVSFELPQAARFSLDVYNLFGQRVSQLVSSSLPSGAYQRDFNLGALPAGTYLLRMQADQQVTTTKVVVR